MLTAFLVLCFFLRIKGQPVPSLQPDACDKTAEGDSRNELAFVCPPGCHIGNVLGVYGTAQYTIDSLICAAAIHDGRITDTGGIVIVNKVGSVSTFTGSTANLVTTQTYGSSYNAFSFLDPSAVPASCFFSVEDYEPNVFVHNCGNDCESHSDDVWGTSEYTRDSQICAAAVLDGQVPPTSTSDTQVIVIKTRGLGTYPADTANGITSQLWDAFYPGFQFATTIPMDCILTFGDLGITTTVTDFLCPSDCDQHNYNDIKGTGEYTEDSQVCIAAIHKGQIEAATGGRVLLRKLVGPPNAFIGSTNNGVTTISSGSGDGFTFDDCVNGVVSSSPSLCACNANWYEAACDTYCLHGNYSAGTCTCDSGYVGPMCNRAC
uniref:uncharacterized protein LOC120346264 n=1 Tax=Styela clava TaxID=7725 RepID=UPI00193AB72F|nr:uncharacterized protein LOC120346264 [Styela clava]